MIALPYTLEPTISIYLKYSYNTVLLIAHICNGFDSTDKLDNGERMSNNVCMSNPDSIKLVIALTAEYSNEN